MQLLKVAHVPLIFFFFYYSVLEGSGGGGGVGKAITQRVGGKCFGHCVLEQFGKETGAKRAVAKGRGPIGLSRAQWHQGGVGGWRVGESFAMGTAASWGGFLLHS